MKLFFLTIGLPDMNVGGGFYADMITEMKKKGHDVTAVAATLENQAEGLYDEGGIRVLRVPLKKMVGVKNFLKKGLAVVYMSYAYKKAYKKYLFNENFDVVFMPTPPASLVDVANLIKKKSGAKFYLILRDIHPESLKRDVIPDYVLKRDDVYDECKKPYSVNKFAYWFMYRKSQKLYRDADYIGCMSPGNIQYIEKIAFGIDSKKLLLLPNWYTETPTVDFDEKQIREKYDLVGKYVAIYGGTIGTAQAVWNIATLAKHFKSDSKIVFLVVGRGVRKPMLQDMAARDNLTNIRFLEYMPRQDYESILRMADVGLISLDEKYPVPTCPSKIIGYMAMKKPVIAMLNAGSDYGPYYMGYSGCGLWSENLDHKKMFANFERLYRDEKLRKQMGLSGYDYFKSNLTTEKICSILNEQIEEK